MRIIRTRGIADGYGATAWSCRLAAVAALGLLVAGCGGGDQATTAGATDGQPATVADASKADDALGEDGKLRIGFVLVGSQNDGAAFQAMASGAKRAAEELGGEAVILDNTPPAEAADAYRSLVEQDVDIIMGVEETEEAMVQVAADHPDQKFTMQSVSGAIDLPNVAFYKMDEKEPALLAGYAAGLLGYKTIGFVSGIEVPVIAEAAAAMEQGLQMAEPDGKVITAYTGDFEDASKHKQAAEALVEQGATLLAPYTGSGAAGVIQVIADAGIGGIGPFRDWCGTDPFWVLSDIADFSFVSYTMAKDFAEGRYDATKETALGVAIPEAARIVICDPGVDQEIAGKVEELRQQVIAGEVEFA